MAAETQRIARLTPLGEVLARIDMLVTPVAPRRVRTAAALGHVLAEDVVATAAVPAVARALRDGFAVAAEAVTDASAYAPVALMPPRQVDTGDRLPDGTDAVMPLDSVTIRRDEVAAIAPVASGDGVLAAGADIAAGTALRRAGKVLRVTDIAAVAAAGIGEVSTRVPRVAIAAVRSGDAIIDAAVRLLNAAANAAGTSIVTEPSDLEAALTDKNADAVIAVGGTGLGRSDASVRALAAGGRVEVHGVALLPGETAAFGVADQRPVLLVPGRIDAVVAVWLTLGRYLLGRLSGAIEQSVAIPAVLTRKYASTLGLTEVLPVRAQDGKAEPIASGYWPLHTIVQANGWILVPPDSEGYPAGAQVMVEPWP